MKKRVIVILLFSVLMLIFVLGVVMSDEPTTGSSGGGSGSGVSSGTVVIPHSSVGGGGSGGSSPKSGSGGGGEGTEVNQNNPLDLIYSTFFNCINKCPTGSCPQPNCRPDYSSGRASIGWVGDCKTGSFTDCIDPTCFDKCAIDRDNSLKNGNFAGKMPSTDVYKAVLCSDASGTMGKDCVTIVNIGTASHASYKQYLKYNCANSCWQDVKDLVDSNQDHNSSSGETNTGSSGGGTEGSSPSSGSGSRGGEGSVPTSGSGGGSSSNNQTQNNCNGCILENKCVSVGYINQGKYCDLSGEFKIQNKAGLQCQNNFECDSNLCINAKCVSGSLWNKIMRWFSGIFGGK